MKSFQQYVSGDYERGELLAIKPASPRYVTYVDFMADRSARYEQEMTWDGFITGQYVSSIHYNASNMDVILIKPVHRNKVVLFPGKLSTDFNEMTIDEIIGEVGIPFEDLILEFIETDVDIIPAKNLSPEDRIEVQGEIF